MAQRAKEIAADLLGEGWRKWSVIQRAEVAERKRIAKGLLRDIKKATGARIKDLEPLLLGHIVEHLDLERGEKPAVLHLTGALTCRHHLGNVPREKFDALGALWDGFNRQRGVAGVLLGYFMAAECTYGENGWHPHFQGGWSIQVQRGEDPIERCNQFKGDFRDYFETHSKDHRITIDWQDDWLQIANGSIDQTIRYVFKTLENGKKQKQQEVFEEWSGSEEVPDVLVNEVTMGAYKRSTLDMWDAPTEDFISLAQSTRGMRWFRVGGIWASAETEKSDEELALEDEEQDSPVAEMAPAAWNQLAQEVRHILCAMVEDVRYGRPQLVQVWAAAEEMVGLQIDKRTIRDTLLSLIGEPSPNSSESPPSDSSS